jgi:hypothetical protein
MGQIDLAGFVCFFLSCDFVFFALGVLEIEVFFGASGSFDYSHTLLLPLQLIKTSVFRKKCNGNGLMDAGVEPA